jgi:Macrocin-O-methyltransferase (TylF)
MERISYSSSLVKFINPLNNPPKEVSRYRNLFYALSNVKIKGRFFEFGVAHGFTINYIAVFHEIPKSEKIFGFDSWEGIPEDWTLTSLNEPGKEITFPKGSWATNKPQVRDNVILIDGLFEQSLPLFLKLHEERPVAFLHVDSDLYSSAKTIFKYLGKYIVSDTIIVFDEWHAIQHEKKAFLEWLEESDKKATILAETNRGQITVKID